MQCVFRHVPLTRKLPVMTSRSNPMNLQRREVLPVDVPDEPSSSWAMGSLCLSMLLSSLGTSSANVALPILAKTFGASFQEIQWVVVAYLLAITSSIVSFGRLGDLLGRRRLLRIGLFVFSMASLFSGLAPALWVLMIARFIQGLGAAILMALSIAFVSEIVPKAKTGRAMGLLGTTSAVGTALGPSLGGFLIHSFGWRAIFLINVPLGLTAFLLVTIHLRAQGQKADPRVEFDLKGTILLGLTLAAYALAMTSGRTHFGLRSLGLLFAAFVALVLFIRTERKATAPLLRLSLFQDGAFRASLFANLIVSAVAMTNLVVGPFYLAFGLKLDPGLVGLVMSAGPSVSALAGIPAGRIVDRFGAQRMTIVGLGGIAIGDIMLSRIPAKYGIPGYVLPMVVATASYAMFQAANNTSVMQNVDSRERGVISGTLSLSRNLGLTTGACFMGAVFAFAVGADDLTKASADAVSKGMRVTYNLAALLIVVALFVVARLRVKTPEKNQS